MFQEVSPFEAECLVEALKEIDIEDVGSSEWLSQHESVERLNKQAHVQARSGDEFVTDALCTFEKVPTLIHELVVIETWKEKLFPLLKKKLSKMSTLRSYLPIYHEASLANLLEVSLFHENAAEAADDQAVDLIAWCHRKLVYLCETPNSELLPPDLDVSASLNQSREEELERLKKEAEFKIAVCALSIVRFLTDHMHKMSPSVATTLLNQHDFLLLLVPLMEKQPWHRVNSKGEPERFEDLQWVPLSADGEGDSVAAERLAQLHAQCWLCVFNLVMSEAGRTRYELSGFRKDNLLKLRRWMNESLYDQLPPLVELHRCLETLAVAGTLGGPNATPPCVVELMPEIRSRLLSKYKGGGASEKGENGKWKEAAKRIAKRHFASENPEELKRLAESLMQFPVLDPRCAVCGKD
eukprot:Cvel_29427.t1-p1 / transcript=Cvel_29427.t1 / gene=Cvel_29427 / organism=Chromera_velia_CCMP2878 / gene_product=Zinc finger MYND domain-containing protein 10, putative / transcript_product=Zinc finger MYND domain-containing protein 10, putative / location=Cvel_scaffold4019:6144-11724(+) / protein_length=410 / sequence_SO=supercontig / SO=protein_coding / is_pseudo=false